MKIKSGRLLTNSGQNNDPILILTGVIFPYGGETAPTGFLLCDGSSYEIDDYPDLYAVIGNNYGFDGRKFRVPDMRGRYMRGVDGDKGQDGDKATRTSLNNGNTGNQVGSVQAEKMQTHGHTVNDHKHTLTVESEIQTYSEDSDSYGGTTTFQFHTFGDTIMPINSSGSTLQIKSIVLTHVIKT
jgi:microcystin-dependent protein